MAYNQKLFQFGAISPKIERLLSILFTSKLIRDSIPHQHRNISDFGKNISCSMSHNLETYMTFTHASSQSKLNYIQR